MAASTGSIVHDLNALLRGEISAAETYKKAIDKIANHDQYASQVQQLHDMQRDHGLAAQELRARINELGGTADNDSGAWGAWANTVQSVANLFGDTSALKALKEGEEHGLKDYERTLDNDIDLQTRSLIHRLIDNQRRHIQRIDALMAGGVR
jgi:uncharacterized protein (TIGR02284 family)